MKDTKPTNVFKQLQNKEFGKVRVVSNEKGEGYINLYDLCRVLELSVKEVLQKLHGHLFTVTMEDTTGEQHSMTFVDEYGLCLVYLLCNRKDAIRFQNWLDEEFLQSLDEQRKALVGLKKDDKLVLESNLQLQALRYMATAANVIKSGHFKAGKAIPELTLSHLLGW